MLFEKWNNFLTIHKLKYMEEGLVKDWFVTITFLDNFLRIRRLLKSDEFLAID